MLAAGVDDILPPTVGRRPDCGRQEPGPEKTKNPADGSTGFLEKA
jgi:hypothetical protein